MIDIALAKLAGISDDKILKYLELYRAEYAAKRREQNRINKQNQRSRQHVSRVSADNADTGVAGPLSFSLTSSESKEEEKERKKVSKRRAREIPADWHPNSGHAALCETLHVPLGEVEAVFRDSCAATGKLYVNHDSAFNTYIRNFNKFSKGSGNERARTSQASSSANILAGFGRVFGGGDGAVAGPVSAKIPRGKTEFDL